MPRRPDRHVFDEHEQRQPHGPLEEGGGSPAEHEQAGASDEEGGKQDYPCREVGTREGAQEAGQDMEYARKES